jgi:hypothetical protein
MNTNPSKEPSRAELITIFDAQAKTMPMQYEKKRTNELEVQRLLEQGRADLAKILKIANAAGGTPEEFLVDQVLAYGIQLHEIPTFQIFFSAIDDVLKRGDFDLLQALFKDAETKGLVTAVKMIYAEVLRSQLAAEGIAAFEKIERASMGSPELEQLFEKVILEQILSSDPVKRTRPPIAEPLEEFLAKRAETGSHLPGDDVWKKLCQDREEEAKRPQVSWDEF